MSFGICTQCPAQTLLLLHTTADRRAYTREDQLAAGSLVNYSLVDARAFSKRSDQFLVSGTATAKVTSRIMFAGRHQVQVDCCSLSKLYVHDAPGGEATNSNNHSLFGTTQVVDTLIRNNAFACAFGLNEV